MMVLAWYSNSIFLVCFNLCFLIALQYDTVLKLVTIVLKHASAGEKALVSVILNECSGAELLYSVYGTTNVLAEIQCKQQCF